MTPFWYRWSVETTGPVNSRSLNLALELSYNNLRSLQLKHIWASCSAIKPSVIQDRWGVGRVVGFSDLTPSPPSPSPPLFFLEGGGRGDRKNNIETSFVFCWIKYIGGCSSIGRTTVCGTVSSLFKSGRPPLQVYVVDLALLFCFNFFEGFAAFLANFFFINVIQKK